MTRPYHRDVSCTEVLSNFCSQAGVMTLDKWVIINYIELRYFEFKIHCR